MRPAASAQIALTGEPAPLVRTGVIQVAPLSRLTARRETAGPVPGHDELPQPPGRPVRRAGFAVSTRSPPADRGLDSLRVNVGDQLGGSRQRGSQELTKITAGR